MFWTLSIGYLYFDTDLQHKIHNLFWYEYKLPPNHKNYKRLFYFLFALLLSIIKCIAQLQKMQKASLHAQ